MLTFFTADLHIDHGTLANHKFRFLIKKRTPMNPHSEEEFFRRV